MTEKGLESVLPRPLSTAAPQTGLCLQSETITLNSQERMELINITGLVNDEVRASGVRQGLALVSSLHTTLALFINEFQPALLDDIRSFLEGIVAPEQYYKHNDPQFSDCDRANADAHLRALLLNHNLVLPIRDGELLLGTFQAIILAELDGPRERGVQVQILGA